MKYSKETEKTIIKLAEENNIDTFDDFNCRYHIDVIIFELLEVISLDMQIDTNIKLSDLFNDNIIKILKPLMKGNNNES